MVKANGSAIISIVVTLYGDPVPLMGTFINSILYCIVLYCIVLYCIDVICMKYSVISSYVALEFARR